METRHRTVVEVKLDDKDIEEAGKSMTRAFDPKIIEQLEKAFDKVSQTVDVFNRQLERTEKRLSLMDLRARGKLRFPGDPNYRPEEQKPEESPERQPSFWKQVGAVAIGTSIANGMQRVGQGVGSTIGPQGATQGILGMLPLGIGAALSGTIGGIQQYYSDFLSQQTAGVRAMGPAGAFDIDTVASAGQPYGLSPEEAAGRYAQLAGMTGLRGSANLTPAFRKQLAFSNLLGVQNAGAVVGAAGAANKGAVVAPEMLMEKAVSAGLETGIRVTRLDSYLQNVSSWVEGVRTQGIDMSVESALRLAKGFSGLGASFVGEAGARAAQTAAAGVAGLKDKGGMGTALAYRAAQRVMPGASLEDLRVLIEQPNQDMMREFISMAREMAGNSTVALEQILQASGIRMSTAQARDIMRGDLSSFDNELSPQRARQEMGRQGFTDQFGSLAVQAGLQRQRGAYGASLAGEAQQLQLRDVEISKRMMPFMSSAVSVGSDLTMKGLDEVFKWTKDPLGRLGQVMDDFSYIVEETGRKIRDSISDIFEDEVVKPLLIPRTAEDNKGIGGAAVEPVLPPPTAPATPAAPAEKGPLSMFIPMGGAAEALRYAADQIDAMGREHDRLRPT